MADEEEMAALRADVDELKAKFAALEEWLRDLGRRAAAPQEEDARPPQDPSGPPRGNPGGQASPVQWVEHPVSKLMIPLRPGEDLEAKNALAARLIREADGELPFPDQPAAG